MKNYYKILGVKETASEEEIREKWIKLMRKFHPDWRTQGVPKDERVKEINEAYQTLKFSSTRMRYDLKKAYQRKKRKSNVRKYSFPISMLTALIALIIAGSLYLKNSTNNPSVPNIFNNPKVSNNPNGNNGPNGLNEPNVQNGLNDTDQPFNASTLEHFNDPNGINRPNGLNEPKVLNVKKSTKAKNPIDSKKVISGPKVTNRPNDPNELNFPNDLNAYTHQRFNASNDLNGPNEPNVLNEPITQLPNNLITKLHNDPAAQKVVDSSPSTSDFVMDSSSQLPKPSNIPDIPDESSVPDKSNDLNILNEPNEPNGPNNLNVVHMTASTHQPSMATEQEIKQFLANYTERYIRKDLDEFLSLFSPRAVQNSRDGWEGIRKIYGEFFKHSKDLRYSLEDTEIEFYQNGLEVKASYELTQTLKRRDEMKTWRGYIRWVLIEEEGALKILSLDYQHYKIP
jgi:curved DNA-binding protein CbpA